MVAVMFALLFAGVTCDAISNLISRTGTFDQGGATMVTLIVTIKAVFGLTHHLPYGHSPLMSFWNRSETAAALSPLPAGVASRQDHALSATITAPALG